MNLKYSVLALAVPTVFASLAFAETPANPLYNNLPGISFERFDCSEPLVRCDVVTVDQIDQEKQKFLDLAPARAAAISAELAAWDAQIAKLTAAHDAEAQNHTKEILQTALQRSLKTRNEMLPGIEKDQAFYTNNPDWLSSLDELRTIASQWKNTINDVKIYAVALQRAQNFTRKALEISATYNEQSKGGFRALTVGLPVRGNCFQTIAMPLSADNLNLVDDIAFVRLVVDGKMVDTSDFFHKNRKEMRPLTLNCPKVFSSTPKAWYDAAKHTFTDQYYHHEDLLSFGMSEYTAWGLDTGAIPAYLRNILAPRQK